MIQVLFSSRKDTSIVCISFKAKQYGEKEFLSNYTHSGFGYANLLKTYFLFIFY